MFTIIVAVYSEVTAEYINRFVSNVGKLLMLQKMIHIGHCVVYGWKILLWSLTKVSV
jgi:hypothetical protein